MAQAGGGGGGILLKLRHIDMQLEKNLRGGIFFWDLN